MKLTGIIEEVFRGVTIFRGYATLKTLAKLSSSTNYQRDLIGKRIDEILLYMKESQFLFFPELILGWQIEDNEAINKIKKDESASGFLIENGIRIKKSKFKFKSLSDGEEPKTKVVTIEIPDTISNTLFSRIDGNHRLVVIDKIMQGETDVDFSDVCNQIAPFCLIIQQKDTIYEAKKQETAYFYLINSKAVPLTNEQNLKAIFSSGVFTDNEKENLAIVKDHKKYENVVKVLTDGHYQFVSDLFYGEVYSLALKIMDQTSVITLEELRKALIAVEALYNRGELPGTNKNIVLSLIIAYAKHGHNIFDGFRKWLSDNQLVKIEKVKPDELLTAYEELRKEIKIFVAMPYFNGDADVVRSYNEAYCYCINRLKEEDPSLNISVFPIMENDGETRNIDEQIFRQIEQCSIFIADVSEKNEGVYLEYGYAKAKDKYRVIMKSDNLKIKPHFDLDHDSRVSYKTNDNLHTFKVNLIKNLKTLLNNNYGFHFSD